MAGVKKNAFFVDIYLLVCMMNWIGVHCKCMFINY